MASVAMDLTLQRLRRKASSSPEIADALRLLAADDPVDDPFAVTDDAALGSVRAINRRRQAGRRTDLSERSLTTAEVVGLVDSMSDRRAVDRRRQRGRLLGVKVGTRVLHPAWQFDAARGETREGLEQVIEALGAVAPDPSAADALMTATRTDLGGSTIAGLLEHGEVELALRLIRLAGDQS